MRVLLIEDDSATAQSIELMLKSESFNVYTTDLGEEGVDLGKLYDYDIILLDLNLPDMSGFEVLRSLRVSKVKTPILILTGLAGHRGQGQRSRLRRRRLHDQAVPQGRAGRAHPRHRAPLKGHAQSVIQTGDLVVNLDTKTVEVNGARVHLTGKEYQMLELLEPAQGHDADQGDVPQPSLRRHGRAGAQDHRRVHLQAAQEARQRLERQELHRDGVGPRLRAARAVGGRVQDPGLTIRPEPFGRLHPRRETQTPPAMAGFRFFATRTIPTGTVSRHGAD